jgi:hypothetical protein
MPRGHRARAVDEPEMMDMEDAAAPELVEPVAEPHVADEEEEEAEQEEMITLKAADFYAL